MNLLNIDVKWRAYEAKDFACTTMSLNYEDFIA